jgi:hypothetical protein
VVIVFAYFGGSWREQVECSGDGEGNGSEHPVIESLVAWDIECSGTWHKGPQWLTMGDRWISCW